jgi:hypothetical protein
LRYPHLMTLSPHQKELALKIARGLDDMKMLPYHESLVLKFTEDYLLDRYEYVMSRPKETIKTNRAAAYIHLVIYCPHFTYNRSRD